MLNVNRSTSGFEAFWHHGSADRCGMRRQLFDLACA